MNFSNLSLIQQNPPCENWATSFPVKISQMVFLSIIFFFSLVGNTLLIITVYKRPELKKTVNYFIVNMAFSDFVFPLTAIPAALAEMSFSSWPIDGTAGSILCKLKNFVIAVSLTVSIESLVWIAVDRFLAVVWPMKVHLITSRFRAFAIASTWIVALTVNSADLYLSKLRKDYGKMTCIEDRISVLFIVISYTRLVLLYLARLVLIPILYGNMIKLLQCTTVHRNDHKKRQAIKMSLCVAGLFYLFFLPFSTVLVFWHTPVSKSCLYDQLFLISSSVICLSSRTNSIICFTFVESFRRGLREVFKLPERSGFKLCGK